MDQVLTSFVMAVIIFIVARIAGLELWLAAELAGVAVRMLPPIHRRATS